jgi:hypothetical protein
MLLLESNIFVSIMILLINLFIHKVLYHAFQNILYFRLKTEVTNSAEH